MQENNPHTRPPDGWDGINRRRTALHAGDADFFEHPHQARPLHKDPQAAITVEYLDQSLAQWREASREYFNGHFDRLEKLIRDGFPDGDPGEHRKVHEGYILKAKNRSEMWQAVLKQVLTGSVYAGLVAIGTALWVAFKTEVKK